LTQLRQDFSVSEVILSGGDPLSLSDDKLAGMIADLESVPQLKRLRIHTRLPLVLPERIDDQLLDWLQRTRLKTVMVIHANHANEIDSVTAEALQRLDQADCQLLNQSVLLKGVNDSVQSLSELSERLFDVKVLPYYLHLLDRVSGAQHFEVTDEIGVELIEELRRRLPGYLVPRLVREQQGEPSKTVIR
jgi:EF-P beta-lysylation protein EpmB